MFKPETLESHKST